MIWYFQEDIQPLVKVEMQQRGPKLESFYEIIEKAVKADANAAPKPHSKNHDTDQHYTQSNRLAATRSYAKNPLMKDSRAKEVKFWTNELRRQELRASQL